MHCRLVLELVKVVIQHYLWGAWTQSSELSSNRIGWYESLGTLVISLLQTGTKDPHLACFLQHGGLGGFSCCWRTISRHMPENGRLSQWAFGAKLPFAWNDHRKSWKCWKWSSWRTLLLQILPNVSGTVHLCSVFQGRSRLLAIGFWLVSWNTRTTASCVTIMARVPHYAFHTLNRRTNKRNIE